jgi:hypothetical protein
MSHEIFGDDYHFAEDTPIENVELCDLLAGTFENWARSQGKSLRYSSAELLTVNDLTTEQWNWLTQFHEVMLIAEEFELQLEKLKEVTQ